MSEAEIATKELWDNILGRLPTFVLRRLGAPVKVEFDDNAVKIVAPSQFALNLISESLDQIQRAFAELGMRDVRFQLIIDTGLEATEDSAPEAGAEQQGNLFASSRERERPSYFLKPNPKWIFETLCQGPYNRFAYFTGQRFANWDTGVPPCFIVAASGSGKSHLAHAIWQEAMKNRQGANVVYVHAKAFMEQYRRISRAEGSRGEADRKSFSKKYHNADMFIMDDVHLLDANDWTKSRQELRFILDDLQEQSALILLISVRSVDSFAKCEEELKSRLRAMAMIKMDPPDYQARIAILKRYARERGISFPDENGDKFLEMILERLPHDMRMLGGAISTLDGYLKAMGDATLDEGVITTLFGEYRINPRLSIAIIQDVIASHFNLTVRDLKLKRQECPMPWEMAVYLCRDMLHASIQDVASAFEVDASAVNAVLRSISKHGEKFFGDSATIREKLVSI